MSRAAREDAQVALVPCDRIDFHPRNVRHDLGDLRDLAENIAVEGVLVPLMAERRGPRLRLLHGHRRLAAARQVGVKKVPVVVVREHEDDEAIGLMIAENTRRRGLSREEKRDAVATLRGEFGLRDDAIAERFGISIHTVRAWAAGGTTLEKRTARRAETDRARRAAGREFRPAAGSIYRVMERWRGRVPDALIAELDDAIRGWRPAETGGFAARGSGAHRADGRGGSNVTSLGRHGAAS